MTVLGDSLQHKNYFSWTRIAFLRREILLEKYTRNIVKSRKTRITMEKSNSRSHRQRMCISLVILLRELLPTETRFVLFSPRISHFSSNYRLRRVRNFFLLEIHLNLMCTRDIIPEIFGNSSNQYRQSEKNVQCRRETIY